MFVLFLLMFLVFYFKYVDHGKFSPVYATSSKKPETLATSFVKGYHVTTCGLCTKNLIIMATWSKARRLMSEGICEKQSPV